MTSITNNHTIALGLPDGTILHPGIASNVPGWDKMKGNAVIKAWSEAGILTTGDSVPAADEKAELQERLDAAGVKYDKRAGVEKLRQLLADAGEGEEQEED